MGEQERGLGPRQVTFVEGAGGAGDADPSREVHPDQGSTKLSPTAAMHDPTTEDAMSAQLIECPCGTVLRGEDLEEVVSEARSHARTVHGMELSAEQAASMARPT